jgi:CheY-like chemotaxis protein
MLGHELRNPLAPIRNAVEILRLSEDPEVRERARTMVARQVQHLTRLVDDLLDVSRITERKIELKRAVVRLEAVVDAAVDIARPSIDSMGHQFIVANHEAARWVNVDPVRMAQAIGNLLHNAAKFTPRGGRIDLEVSLRGPLLAIEVRDNGVGISADVLPSVFDLFTQGERSLDRSQGGLGIGLSLVKGLVHMHGGEVGAVSGGPGQGSTFLITLPLEKIGASAPRDAAQAARPEDAPRRILLVEDNADAAESMMLLLQARGHEVTVVNDGHDALATARRIAPEVVLLDLGLPGMDGFQLAAALRAMPETSRAHLIAVSGYGQEKDRARSAQAGFDLHLVKPVDPERLVQAIGLVAAT